MKTMEKAKFKAQKITSKAHSEQFILMLGFKMLQKEDAQKFVTCLFHMDLNSVLNLLPHGTQENHQALTEFHGFVSQFGSIVSDFFQAPLRGSAALCFSMLLLLGPELGRNPQSNGPVCSAVLHSWNDKFQHDTGTRDGILPKWGPSGHRQVADLCMCVCVRACTPHDVKVTIATRAAW